MALPNPEQIKIGANEMEKIAKFGIHLPDGLTREESTRMFREESALRIFRAMSELTER